MQTEQTPRRPERSLETSQRGEAQGYDCPRYEAKPRSKRCKHYQGSGTCALATQFKCVEWLKANGRPLPEGHPALTEPAVQHDLFGHPVPERRHDADASQPTSTPAAEALPAEPPARRWLREPITQEEIDSFKALGVEVCIRIEELGEVWLVPEYTGQDRKEISPEHAATLRLLLDAFPEGRVTAFEKLAQAREPMP